MRTTMLAVVLSLGIMFFILPVVHVASSEGMDWHKEFEEICSMVQAGDALTVDELKDLIERTDKLMEEIEKLDIPSKKVYLFRLKKCRKFFNYILELKESPKESGMHTDFPGVANT